MATIAQCERAAVAAVRSHLQAPQCARIAGLWPAREFNEAHAQGAACAGRGGVLTPGLVDCHTHLVHGGHRAGEFAQRLEGAGYEEIARAGGGIVSSVKATNAYTVDELVAAALPRLDKAACAAIMNRARYRPARDAAGRAVATSKSRRVTWRLPD